MGAGFFGRRGAHDVPALLIAHITVRSGKLDFELSCDEKRLRVDARAAARALGLLPNLARHVCVNRKGERFADDIEDTESAHLFEHVAIELLGQAFPAQAAAGAFRGYTTHADVGEGECAPGFTAMRTTISCPDDLAGMCAAREALRVVNWALDASAHASDHAPGCAPAHASRHVPGRASAHASCCASAHVPARVSGHASGGLPDGDADADPAPDVEAMVHAVRTAASADAR